MISSRCNQLNARSVAPSAAKPCAPVTRRMLSKLSAQQKASIPDMSQQMTVGSTDTPKSAGNNVVPLRSVDVPSNDEQRLYAKWENLQEKVRKPGSSPDKVKARTTPSAEHLAIWQTADAVCFDVDCTITVNDGLDVLADFMGVGPQIEAITTKAMDGTVGLEEALAERLNILNCTPNDVRRFLAANPPTSRLTTGIEKLIKTLLARGVHVYLISGGFREIIIPIAKHLGVPLENVFCNRMNWQWDDETGEPTKLVGFDMNEPTARNQGKPEAIARIREQFPYNNVVMIGDGVTDLEAVQGTNGADLFIGYGGVIEREAVKAEADWFVYDYEDLIKSMKRYKVAMVGSGAFACAVVHMMAQNVDQNDPADMFDDEVKMWVHRSEQSNVDLIEVINETHENPKYLPGVDLGKNVVAVPDLQDVVRDADVLVFCAPHQFMHSLCKQLAGKVKKGAIAISCTKGMRVTSNGPQLISQMVTKYLGIDCSVLMGANIAADIGREQLSEAVIGYYSRSNGKLLQQLFESDYFGITLIPDAVGAEMCGTLKNIVAVAAGMIDGLGLGNNSKAAIMRQGLFEMRKLSKALYPTVRDETFLESCGVADLIATCYGGRNRLIGMEWTKARLAGKSKTFEELEKELLNGQKLQGVLTSNEVQEILEAKKWEDEYPLFTTINRVIKGKLDVNMVVKFKEGARMKVLADTQPEGEKKKAPRKEFAM